MVYRIVAVGQIFKNVITLLEVSCNIIHIHCDSLKERCGSHAKGSSSFIERHFEKCCSHWATSNYHVTVGLHGPIRLQEML